MSKVTGAYDSLIKGVSEQVAHSRFPGQHWDQLNMVSDPIRGLARRRGSIFNDMRVLPSTVMSEETINDIKYFGEQSLYLGATEYSFMYRKIAKSTGSTMPGMTLLDKSNGKLLGVNVSATDTLMAQFLDKGINSVTAVGNLVLFAINDYKTEFSQVNEVTAGIWANHAVAWIKGGSYSRTYTLAVKTLNGTVITVQHKTPASYYPGTLDTSDIPATIDNGSGTQIPNPNYQKLVNDRVYAYQAAVNAWIGTAAAGIQPTQIAVELANRLREALTTAGITEVQVATVNSTICIGYVSSLSVDDGGDGSQASGVARIVKQASDLSTVHVDGKVVQIKPLQGSSKSYYVKATAKTPGDTFWTEVVWEEAAGVEVAPTSLMAVGCVKDGAFYVASSPERLAVLANIEVPGWAKSSSGDLESQSLPAFLGGEINYIRMFQDRLIIVSGATVFMSRSGDYFNFFRQSALTIQDNDPIEVYALGSQDDVVTAGTLLDRNLILFGKQWQYAVSGRDAIVPTTAYVAVQSGYRDSNDCPPETSGNLIFFTQQRQGKLTVQQMQTGAYADTLTAYEITQQLNKFLTGTPQQIVAVTSPSAMFVRTDAEQHGFWVYNYLDSAGNEERLFDAWSKWTFNPGLGNLLSMCAKDGDLLVTTVRQRGDGVVSLVTDTFTLSTDVPDCHLDSQRPYGGEVLPSYPGITSLRAVYNKASGRYWMLGDSYDRVDALRTQIGTDQDVNLVVGAEFDSYAVLTNPYMRDRDGKAILDARLTLGNLNITLFESSAMNVSICDLVDAENAMYVPTLKWIARSANGWVLNTQQVADSATVVAGVYKEIRECKVKLASRSWLPLTISSIEWQGQFFTRRRR